MGLIYLLAPPPPMTETKVISFRVDERHHTLLAEHATTAGQSVGELARQLVLEGLLAAQVTAALEQSLLATLEEVKSLRGALRELQGDLATGFKAVLVTAGKVPAEDADAWIYSNLGNHDA